MERGENVALSVLRRLPDASVLVFDRSLRFILVAGEALARHGIVPEQFENRRCADVLAADRWAVYEPMYRAALAGGTSSIEVDAINHGRRYLVDVGPFRSESGDVVGGVVIARDVTARRNAENQLRGASGCCRTFSMACRAACRLRITIAGSSWSIEPTRSRSGSRGMRS